jgi:hypothetical protein
MTLGMKTITSVVWTFVIPTFAVPNTNVVAISYSGGICLVVDTVQKLYTVTDQQKDDCH